MPTEAVILCVLLSLAFLLVCISAFFGSRRTLGEGCRAAVIIEVSGAEPRIEYILLRLSSLTVLSAPGEYARVFVVDRGMDSATLESCRQVASVYPNVAIIDGEIKVQQLSACRPV